MEGVSNGPIPSNAGLLIAKCLGLFPQLRSDQAVQTPLYKQAMAFGVSVSGLRSHSVSGSDNGHVQYDISFLLAYAYARTGYYLTSLTNVDALRHVDPSAWALTPRCEVK